MTGPDAGGRRSQADDDSRRSTNDDSHPSTTGGSHPSTTGGSRPSASLQFDEAAFGRFLVVLGLAFVPWTVLVSAQLTFVFPFGLLNTDPVSLLTVPAFLRATGGAFPGFVESWLIGSGCYVVALVSAGAGAVWREDRRLTGGFLALAAIAQFPFALGWSVQPGRVAIPAGAVVVLGVVWWRYWPDRRRTFE